MRKILPLLLLLMVPLLMADICSPDPEQAARALDNDGDGVPDTEDNCPDDYNPNQYGDDCLNDTPEPGSVTPLETISTLELGPWANELKGAFAATETADDKARQDYPNYATDPVQAQEFAYDLQGPANQLLNQLSGELSPPPEGLEEEYNVLQQAVATWTYAFPVADVAAIDSELADVQAACEPIQVFIDDAGEDVDLNCDFSDEPLSAEAYFPQVEEAMQTAHDEVDASTSDFNSATPGGDRGYTLDTYLSGVLSGYGAASDTIALLEPPVDAAAGQTAFVSASAALEDAYETVIFAIKDDPVGGVDVAYNSLPTTWDPAVAAVEAACAQLQQTAEVASVDVDLGCRP